jgi:hypothetical protein
MSFANDEAGQEKMTEKKISSLSTKGQAGSLPAQGQGKKILMLNYEFPPLGGI